MTLHKPGFFHDFFTTQTAETPSMNQNRKSPSTPIGFQPVTWFHRYTCLGETELLGSVKNIFGGLDFYFKDSNSVKMCLFFEEKKRHSLTKKKKKLHVQLFIPFSMSPLGEKKTSENKKKREKHTASYGASTNMGLLNSSQQIQRGVIGWVTCSMPWWFNVAVDRLGFF